MVIDDHTNIIHILGMHPEYLKTNGQGIFGIETVEKPKRRVDGVETIGAGYVNTIACLRGPTCNKEHVTATDGWYAGNDGFASQENEQRTRVPAKKHGCALTDMIHEDGWCQAVRDDARR